ncbi:ATP-binding protein [Dactylosporangium sp. NPDC049525]|uniref:sensor histidine kinase n=1 Tax=Dactylosporangium sp. NPDC049525 TaxID=3154730 RepID=UPI00343D15B6
MSGRTDPGQLAARRRLAAVGRARANLAGWQPSVQRLADLIVEAAGVPVSVVSLVTADSQVMLGCAGGEGSAGAAFEIPLSASLCREVVVTGLPFIARDTAADARFAGTDPVLVHGIRAYAGFPVADEDGLILGVVSVAKYEPHEWTVAQLSTVDNAAQLFAELLGGANAAAGGNRAVQEQRAFLDAVAAVRDGTGPRRVEQLRRCQLSVARAMAEASDTRTAGQAVLTAVNEALGWPYSELWCYDPAAGTMRPLAQCHRAGFGPPPQVPPRLATGVGLAGRAWSADGPVWVEDVDRAGLLVQDPAADLVLRSAVVVPVCSGEDCFAALVWCSAAAEAPDDLLSVLLTGIAAEVGQHLQRRRAEGLALQLARSRHEYVRLVGHELRTPLTSIAACTELLSAFGDELPGDARELLEAVTRNSDRLRHIINALLDLAALDSGHVVLRHTGFDLAATVRAAAACPGPAEGPVRVHVKAPDVLMVEADEPRIRDVVRALLGNAVMYSHPGGDVSVTLTTAGDHACLTVADTGIGIPPNELDQVFERFQRSSRVRDLGIPGLGLGLATSRTVLERHRGTITVRETPGGGTTAEVRLPLRQH